MEEKLLAAQHLGRQLDQREVFDRIAEYRVNRVDELLPWNIGRVEPLSQRQAA